MRIGAMEIILIIVLALILFGGTKIAGLGKSLGKSIKEFRNEIRSDEKPAADATPAITADPGAVPAPTATIASAAPVAEAAESNEGT